jgi:hypothetical protein
VPGVHRCGGQQETLFGWAKIHLTAAGQQFDTPQQPQLGHRSPTVIEID